MLHAGCPTNETLLSPPPDIKSVKVRVGDDPNKATIDLETGEILIDERYLDSLSEDSVEAVLLHETAHMQRSGCARHCDGKPNGCERCADNRLGACLALNGYDRQRANRALVGMQLSRKTMLPDAMAGFDYASTRQKNANLDAKMYPVNNLNGYKAIFEQPMTATFAVNADTSNPFRTPPPMTARPAPPVLNVPVDPPVTFDDVTPGDAGTDSGIVPDAGCSTDCNYDYGWVVGVGGALFSVGVIATQWIVKS